MSNRKYPRIGSVSKTTKSKSCFCGEPATHRIDVQYNYFRGDDEVVYVCEGHKRATIDELKAAGVA